MHLIGCLSFYHLVVFFLELQSVLSFGPLFKISPHLSCSNGWNLKYLPVQGNPLCCVVVLPVREGSEREQCHLLGFQLAFSHFPCYPQANWALLVLIPWVGGFVYILGPCGSLRWTLLWGWEFLPPPQSPQGLRLYFLVLESWVTWSASFPSCSSWVIHMQIWDHPVHQPPHPLVLKPLSCPSWSSSHSHTVSPLHPGCLPLPSYWSG